MVNKVFRAFKAFRTRIGFKLAFVVGAMLVLAIGSLVINYLMVKRHQFDASLINMAGRQRMLTQQIVKYAYELYLERFFNEAAPRHELIQSVALYDSTLRILTYGDSRLGLPPAKGQAYEQLLGLQHLWKRFRYNLNLLLTLPVESDTFRAALQFLKSNNEKLLDESDRTVTLLEKQAKHRVSQLLILLDILFFFDLLLFGTVFILLRRLLLSPLYRIRDGLRQMAAGDLSYRIALGTGDELEKVAREINILAETQEMSQNELAKRSEELSRINRKLRAFTAELEEKVKERTTALQAANRDLKGKQAQLLAANEELQSFTYSVSHDLRAPLVSINGFTNLLIQDFGKQLGQEALRLLQSIIRNTHRMNTLISDFLILSRASFQNLNQVVVSMSGMVKLTCEELGIAALRGIQLEIEPLPKAHGDPTLLRQVWQNLLNNAVKYTQPGKVNRIQVGGERRSNEHVYHVKDTGIGFDSVYKEKIFQLFQRLHSESDFPGTGVGLAIVERIIKRHGGRVWAESTPGEGSTFYFALPLPGKKR